MPHYGSCKIVLSHAPYGETVEMPNQVPWLLLVIIILLPLAENECLKSSHLIRSINNPVSSQDLTCKGKKLSANKFNRT